METSLTIDTEETLRLTKAVVLDRPKVKADIVVETLANLGVKAAFGIPGGAFYALFDALTRAPSIEVILAQHEGAAAYMAMGRSMAAKGREVGLCFATSGPGMTNLITGVASAYEERVPLFVLTGNVSTKNIGKGAVQDGFSSGINSLEMFHPITVRSQSVTDETDLIQTVTQLYNFSLEEKKPVHLNLPINISIQKVDTQNAKEFVSQHASTLDIPSFSQS